MIVAVFATDSPKDFRRRNCYVFIAGDKWRPLLFLACALRFPLGAARIFPKSVTFLL